MENKYLFVVCMNGSGSTLLHQYLGRCKNVAELERTSKNRVTSVEGQNHVRDFMPQPKTHKVVGKWTQKSYIFSDDKNYNWSKIKENGMTAGEGLPEGP